MTVRWEETVGERKRKAEGEPDEDRRQVCKPSFCSSCACAVRFLPGCALCPCCMLLNAPHSVPPLPAALPGQDHALHPRGACKGCTGALRQRREAVHVQAHPRRRVPQGEPNSGSFFISELVKYWILSSLVSCVAEL